MKGANYSLPCPLWPDHPSRCDVILALKRVCASLSIIGCLFIIFIIWLFRNYKSQVQRMTLYLCISAGFAAIMYVVSNVHATDGACQATAFLMQYADWVTLLWVCAISVNMVLIIRNIPTTPWEKWYHLVCWGLPFLPAALPFIGHKYGPAGLWCWIVRDATGFRFGTWYVPIFFLLAVVVVIYIYIIVTVLHEDGSFSGFSRSAESQDAHKLAKEVKPLIAFPLIYITISVMNLIYRIDDAVHPDELPSYPLCILNALFVPSNGALIAMAFALYSDIYKLLTWNQLKFALVGRFSSTVTVIHNVDVDDAEPVVQSSEDDS